MKRALSIRHRDLPWTVDGENMEDTDIVSVPDEGVKEEKAKNTKRITVTCHLWCATIRWNPLLRRHLAEVVSLRGLQGSRVRDNEWPNCRWQQPLYHIKLTATYLPAKRSS